MNNSKIFLIFFLITNSIFNLSTKSILANQKNNYTITSDTQTQSEDGIFEAFGNVIINNESNLSAKSDKLIYEKDQSRIYLKGNVKIENYESENFLIENVVGDELILFTNRSGFEINSKNGNRVKSNLKF
tara:strand:- start:721 stop:1110 length:390 start_codon:yes stop_codon:yes gene_type:complete